MNLQEELLQMKATTFIAFALATEKLSKHEGTPATDLQKQLMNEADQLLESFKDGFELITWLRKHIPIQR